MDESKLVKTEIVKIGSVQQPDSEWFMTNIAVGPAENLYVVAHSQTKAKIQVFSQNGQLLKKDFGNRFFHRKIYAPTALTRLGDRKVAIYDSQTKMVKVFFDSEDLDSTFPLAHQPDSMTSNNYGHLVLTHHTPEERILTIMNPANGYIMQSMKLSSITRTMFGYPAYAAITEFDQIIILDRARCNVTGFSAIGVKCFQYGSRGFLVGHMNNPAALTLDGFGNIIIADCKNDRIIRFSISHGDCGVLVQDIKNPLGVCVSNNSMFVLTAREIVVFKYDLRRSETTPSILVQHTAASTEQ